MSKIEKEIESYLENKEYEIDYKKQLGSTNLSKVEFGEKDGCEPVDPIKALAEEMTEGWLGSGGSRVELVEAALRKGTPRRQSRSRGRMKRYGTCW